MQKARQERYALMAEYCLKHNIPTLFIAHHQGDQAETFLMRLAKGSGLDGLAGMTDLRSYDENVQIARPFLNQPKQALIDYCTQYKIGFANDPSNENTNYLRPRLRHSMKVLEQEGLTHERLSTLTRRLNRARTALEELAYQAYEKAIISKSDNDILLNFEVLQKQQEEIYFRILSYAIADLNPSQQYNVRMDKLENLFEDIWYNFDIFKPRTLGGVVFALKDNNKVLYIKKECS